MPLLSRLFGRIDVSEGHHASFSPVDRPQLHRIFLIPELVSAILSFLPTHILLRQPRLVCRQWYVIATVLAEPRLPWTSSKTIAHYNPAPSTVNIAKLLAALTRGRCVDDDAYPFMATSINKRREISPSQDCHRRDQGCEKQLNSAVGHHQWPIRTLVLQADSYRKWYDYGGYGVMSTARERELAWSWFESSLIEITHGTLAGSESLFSRAKISTLIVHGDIPMLTRVEPLLTKSAALSSSPVQKQGSGLDNDNSIASPLPSYNSSSLFPALRRENDLGGHSAGGGLAVLLTEIQILEAMSEPTLYLGCILSSCPHLVRLVVESATKRHAGDFLPVQLCLWREISDAPRTTPTPLKIKSLTIRKMKLDRETFESLIKLSSNLESLRLEAIYPAHSEHTSTQHDFDDPNLGMTLDIDPRSLDRITVFRLLARDCPFLRDIHVSFDSTPMVSSEEVQRLADAFEDLESWSLNTRDLASRNFATLMARKTKQITQHGDGQDDTLYRLERRPFSHGHSPFLLAELEIIAFAQDVLYPEGLMEAVHAFLVSPEARALKHLKLATPPSSFTESAGHLLGNDRHRNSGAPYGNNYFNPYLFEQHKVWTCRSLETLHMEIRANAGDASFYAPTPFMSLNSFANKDLLNLQSWASRCLFSYLARVIPNCKELYLVIPPAAMDMKLEGGLCLLRRMSKLERAWIGFHAPVTAELEERDLVWLVSSASATYSIPTSTTSSTTLRSSWLGAKSLVSTRVSKVVDVKRPRWITQIKRKVQSQGQGLGNRGDRGHAPPPSRYSDAAAIEDLEGEDTLVTQMARCVGHLQDIIDCLESVGLDMNPSHTSLPNQATRLARLENLGFLQSLVIEQIVYQNWKRDVGEVTVALVKDLRPDIVFRMEES
ncbi:hypothetical protein BGZ83_000156 [Gryganskiella cystojenkinii]|nr:hypothetical protein BGZ83_000156 [Gryganskiella cystojenkinii]